MTDREVDGVTVLEIEGRIVLGEESNAFREKVKSLLAAGKKKIVVNIPQVGYIDRPGLGTLVATFHSARSQGAVLKLANLGSKFKEVLQVTKLMTVFDTYDSEAAAVASFPKEPASSLRAAVQPIFFYCAGPRAALLTAPNASTRMALSVALPHAPEIAST